MRWLSTLFTLPALAFVLASSLSSTPARADTLAVPQAAPEKAQPRAGTISIDLPGRGMTMAEVEKRFGPPAKKEDEVGDPPITRWVYEDFVVYFEYQYVIHAVATPALP